MTWAMTRIFHLLIYLFGITLFVSCSTGETKMAEQTRKATVEVVQVSLQSKVEGYKFLGTVEANREMKVSFKIGGKIKALGFEEGQLVKAGTLLAELDTTEIRARHEQAIEKKNKAKRDFDRMEKLFKKRIVSLAAFQDSRSVFINAKAELKIVKDRLKSSTIKASFTGRITNKLTEVGEVVSPGTPIGILTEMDPILVKAAVPDNIINKIRSAKTAQVHVDSHPKEVFKGVIHRIESIADQLSRTIRMKIRIDNSDEKLRPGLIAKVKVECGKKDASIQIPLDAIIRLGTSDTVFIVNDFEAQRRLIKTGTMAAEYVEVFEGLNVGELLVVSGQEYLKDGQKVLIESNLVSNR